MFLLLKTFIKKYLIQFPIPLLFKKLYGPHSGLTYNSKRWKKTLNQHSNTTNFLHHLSGDSKCDLELCCFDRLLTLLFFLFFFPFYLLKSITKLIYRRNLMTKACDFLTEIYVWSQKFESNSILSQNLKSFYHLKSIEFWKFWIFLK